MRLESVYVVQCLCGAQVETPTTQTICQKCKRLLDLSHWRKAVDVVDTPAKPRLAARGTAA